MNSSPLQSIFRIPLLLGVSDLQTPSPPPPLTVAQGAQLLLGRCQQVTAGAVRDCLPCYRTEVWCYKLACKSLDTFQDIKITGDSSISGEVLFVQRRHHKPIKKKQWLLFLLEAYSSQSLKRERPKDFNKATWKLFFQLDMSFPFVGMNQVRGSGFESVLFHAINC